MKPIERSKLVREIALKLQSDMNTTQINNYLKLHSILPDDVSIVSSKRVYVEGKLASVSEEKLKNIASELEISFIQDQRSGDSYLKNLMQTHALEDCIKDFERALQAVDIDPAEAIGRASSTLESICKGILDALHLQYPKDQSIQSLYGEVAKLMRLSPEGHADPEIKRLLGGLVNAAQGIGALRTQYGAVHGKGQRNYRLEARHARLAVNGASATGQFLLETFRERFANKQAISERTRRDVIAVILRECRPYHGEMDSIQFLNQIWELNKMSSKGSRFRNAEEYIIQHTIRNDDMSSEELLLDYLNLLSDSDDLFLKFVTLCLHPSSFSGTASEIDAIAKTINTLLQVDSFELAPDRKISGRSTFIPRRIRL